jgi:hypothetical protein
MLVIKGNVQYTIQDSEKETYLARGFSVIDKKGKVIESAKLTIEQEVKALRKENKELKARLKDVK